MIDTFAQQRDLQKQIKDDIDNVCFVCGIDRNTFDRKHPVGFEHHIRNEHNLWHYLSFMVHLRIKEVTEYTGPETYVRDMLAKVRTRGRGRPLGVGLGVGPLGVGFRVDP